MKKFIIATCLILTIFSAFQITSAKDVKRINVGYFEGGQYPVHSIIRDEYYKHLEQLLPDSFQVVFVPEGYRSADWEREQSKDMAKQLSRIPHLDMVLAVGPWVVHDLLEAGFDKPIIALHQFNTKLEKLIDSANRPIAENLTVNYRPDKLLNDLAALTSMKKIKKLGLLYFPSSDEKEDIYALFSEVGRRFGFEIVIGEGDDNAGTFAFFKAYSNLKEKVDAVYLPPMWGFDSHKLGEFLKQLNRDRVPTFTSEGNIMIDRGAFATNDYYGVVYETRFTASKTIEIINGATPADLPVLYLGGNGLAVNLQTAANCNINLPVEITTGYFTIPASFPESTPSYTLNESVNRAITQNPGYLSQFDRLSADKGRSQKAKSGYYPQLEGTASLEYLSDEIIHNTNNRRDDQALLGQLSLTQNILSLPTLKKIKTSKDRIKLTEAEIKSAQLELEYLVSLTFINCKHAEENLKALENNRNLIEHNLVLASAKNQFNDSDTLDVIRLENELYHSIEKVVTAQLQLKNCRIALNSLFNFPASEIINLNGEIIDEKALLSNETTFFDLINSDRKLKKITDKLLALAMSQNPQFSTIDLSIVIKNDLMSESNAGWIPQLSLRGSLNYHDRLKDSPLFTEEKSSWTFGGRATWPIFSGGKKIYEKRIYQSEISSLEYKRDQISLDIMKQIYSTSNRLAQNSRNIVLTFQSKTKATQAMEMAVDQYGRANLTVSDLIDIQKNMVESDLSYIENRFDYFRSMAKLILLCGIPVNDNYSNFVDQFHQLIQY